MAKKRTRWLTLGLAAVAATGAVVSGGVTGNPEKAQAVVFPGAAVLCAGVAFYLVMLGLVAEVALNTERESANEIPTAWEVR